MMSKIGRTILIINAARTAQASQLTEQSQATMEMEPMMEPKLSAPIMMKTKKNAKLSDAFITNKISKVRNVK